MFLTNFPGLRPQWKQNCEEERLIGVDLTGQLDSLAVQDPQNMQMLKEHAIETNLKYATLLGINRAASVTCVKPSGNSSVLLNVSSGIHARWAKHYIRRVRVSSSSPIRKVLADAGVPMHPENGQQRHNATTWVVSFPMKSPKHAVTRNDQNAMGQLEYWLRVKQNWTTHNPSVTVTYKPNEIPAIIDWLFENQDYVGGLTFLPHSDSHYEQMPNEEIDELTYARMMSEFPEIDFSRITLYEHDDNTTAAQELACSSGACELAV